MPDIALTTVAPQAAAVVTGDVNHDGIGAFLGEAFGRVMGAGTVPVGPPFARYQLIDGGFSIAAGFPCAGPAPEGTESLELPGGPAATLLHVGPYTELGTAYSALEVWMSDNGHQPSGAPWETYLDQDMERPSTLITWPCQPSPLSRAASPVGQRAASGPAASDA